jgi:hypothetical protein
MTLDNVLDLLKRRPFDPFRMVTSSGESYEIRHPEMAWPIKNGLYVGLGGKGRLPDRAAFLSLLHISAIETLPRIGSKKRQ